MTMSQAHVRLSRVEDVEAVALVMREMDEFHAAALPDRYHAGSETLELPLVGENSREALFVAEIGGEVAGFVEVHVRYVLRSSYERERKTAHVQRLGVAERYRRRGAGRVLMRAAADWARARGCCEVDLNVHEFNASAVAFYESLGYTTLTRRLSSSL